MESTASSSTSLSASNRKVHRARPLGAGPRQVARSFASASPSSLRAPRWAFLFLPAQRGLQTLFHPSLANIENRLGSACPRLRQLGRPSNRRRCRPGQPLSRIPGTCDRKRRRLPLATQRLQLQSLLFSQSNDEHLLHGYILEYATETNDPSTERSHQNAAN